MLDLLLLEWAGCGVITKLSEYKITEQSLEQIVYGLILNRVEEELRGL